MLTFFLSAFAALSFWIASVAGFGLVVSGNSFIVTTDGGLVFTGTSSLQSIWKTLTEALSGVNQR
jgi:hypothetical protein